MCNSDQILIAERPQQLHQGGYVVFPDHYGLGAQTASVIFELLENDWDADGLGFAQPISVKKHLNITVSKNRGIAIRKDKLNTLDKVIQ